MKEAVLGIMERMNTMADFAHQEEELLKLRGGMIFVRDDAPQVGFTF